MSDELLPYYERELTYLRQLGAEFAGRYPKIASRLVLEEDKCEDPHVERLLEAFAFLAARIHRKLDDELPEITDDPCSACFTRTTSPRSPRCLSCSSCWIPRRHGRWLDGYARRAN